jgi:HAMP domain-containing protein
MLAALVSWFIASGINRPLRKLGDVADALRPAT